MLTENILFLRENYPVLLEKIREEEIDDDGFIEIEETKNGQKTLKIKKDDTSIYLHSKYNPIREAEAIIDKLEKREDVNEKSHIIFYGLGLGYHIQIFTQRHPNIKFSLYEPSIEIFNQFLTNVNLKKLAHTNIGNISCEYNDGVIGIFLKEIMKNKGENIIILDLPIYEKAFEDDHKRFLTSFRDTIKNERTSLHTNYAFQKRWIINSMVNLKEVLNTPNIILEKRGAFKDKPAILVAAGPSLNEEIENIRYIKEKGLAYIFSVGSAVNTLIHHNIYPDAATTYDPGVFNQNVFTTIKEQNIIKIPMIFGSSVGYETIEKYPGMKLHMITSQDTVANYYLKTKEDRNINIVQDAPTIAVVTIQLLNELGFNKIILVGQNLAYRGKEQHSEGINYSGKVTQKQIKDGLLVKDVNGKDILTNQTFNSMRKQMEAYIKILSNIDIINTTKDGACIEGAKFMDLDIVLKNDLIQEVVDKNWLNEYKINYDREYLSSRLKIMDREYKKALNINKSYKNVLKKIEKSINNKNFMQAEKQYVRLDKELKNIEKNDFYKSFILPMNRVQYKILAESIDGLNSILDPYKKGERIVGSFRSFLEVCENDMDDIEETYIDMKQEIYKYINLNGGVEN